MAVGIERLSIFYMEDANEFPDGDLLFGPADNKYIVSVIATNKNLSNGTSTIYVVPEGETDPLNYGLITYNLTIPGYNSYETFRFAINTGDSIWASGSANISYFVQGIEEVV